MFVYLSPQNRTEVHELYCLRSIDRRQYSGFVSSSQTHSKKLMEQEYEFYQRGLEKVQQQDFQTALREFDRALRIDSKFVDAYYQRAICHFDLGNFSAAISDCTQALQLQPQRADIYLHCALAKIAIANYETALVDIQQAIDLDVNLPQAYTIQGTVYRRMGNLPEAIASLKQAAKLYLAKQDKVNCQRCIRTIDEIQAEIQAAQNRDRVRSAQILEYFNNALSKLQRGEYRAALEDFNWLLQVDSKDAAAYCYRGIIKSKLGDKPAAIADLSKALEIELQNTLAYANRGAARSDIGDWRGAIADCDRALQIDPNYLEAYIYRGDAYKKSGNLSQAIADYSLVLKLNVNEPQAYCRRATARLELKDDRGAIEDYQQAANIFLNRQDWIAYGQTLDLIKQVYAAPQRSAVSNATQRDAYIRNRSANSPSLDRLQKQLIGLVGGNVDIAHRLVDLARYKKPEMPEEWYWEKAIYDLLRDR
ncbi:MAG: tetratricopeptide repeat protein [Microcoleus sp.]